MYGRIPAFAIFSNYRGVVGRRARHKTKSSWCKNGKAKYNISNENIIPMIKPSIDVRFSGYRF